MREIKADNHVFNVRGLKRRELKALKKEGIDLSKMDQENADSIMDKVFETVFTPEQIEVIEDLENKHAVKLCTSIIKETYGAPDEEKN